jgi:hypothetical protein
VTAMHSVVEWCASVFERSAHQFRLALTALIVRVDQCRASVAVAHPRLQSPKRHLASCRDPSAERLPQIVEPHDSHAGAMAGLLEALADRGSIERVAGIGVVAAAGSF